MATIDEQIANIQAVPWGNYPDVNSVNIYKFQPPVIIRNGTTLSQDYSQYTITVAFNGSSGSHLITKYVTVTAADSLMTVFSLMESAATLMGNMIAGTDTEQQHKSIDRGMTINLQGTRIQ